MARRYDTHTTTFSPEGRLYQVEYAMQAINNAGAALGISCKEGVVLAAEKKIHSKLLDTPVSLADDVSGEKTYKIDDHIACTVAGLTSDANILVAWLRNAAARHRYTYGEPIPVEQLIQQVCDVKQAYTQYGGQRPFGVSFLFAGYDQYSQFQLYHSDPSGNYAGWKANAVGNNSTTAVSLLKQDWRDDMTLDGALALATAVMSRTVDATALSADKMELSVVSPSGFRLLSDTEVAALVTELEEKRLREEAAKERAEREKRMARAQS